VVGQQLHAKEGIVGTMINGGFGVVQRCIRATGGVRASLVISISKKGKVVVDAILPRKGIG